MELTWVRKNDRVQDAELGRIHGDLSQAFHEGEVTVEELTHPLTLTRVCGVHDDALGVSDAVVTFQRPVGIQAVLRMVNRIEKNARKHVIVTSIRGRYHHKVYNTTKMCIIH